MLYPLSYGGKIVIPAGDLSAGTSLMWLLIALGASQSASCCPSIGIPGVRFRHGEDSDRARVARLPRAKTSAGRDQARQLAGRIKVATRSTPNNLPGARPTPTDPARGVPLL